MLSTDAMFHCGWGSEWLGPGLAKPSWNAPGKVNLRGLVVFTGVIDCGDRPCARCGVAVSGAAELILRSFESLIYKKLK